MKSAHINQLKELSKEAVHAIPSGLVVDGAGRLYQGDLNNPIQLQELLRQIDNADAKVKELHAVIQAIQPRKASK